MPMDLLSLAEHEHDAHDGVVAVAVVTQQQQQQPSTDDSFLINDARDAEPDEVLASSDDAVFQPLPLRTPKRRKIGKALQLVLLRKYVAWAKELNRIPDRPATEHLLAEAYDEFYFHGGNLNEPRLGYSAFLTLIRNRRCEFARKSDRQSEQVATVRSSVGSKTLKEIEEIHALVEELERVRQGTTTPGFDAMDTSEAASTAEDTAPEAQHEAHTPLDQSSPRAPSSVDVPSLSVGSASAVSTFVDGEEHVLVSKRKLDLILRFTQETLQSQKKLLLQVQALERQLLELQSHHHSLGH